MPPVNKIAVELLLSEELRTELARRAMENGRELYEEILIRLQASLQSPLTATAVTDADILAVTSKVALMAGRRGKIQKSNRTSPNARKATK